jgi:hypothetical protein
VSGSSRGSVMATLSRVRPEYHRGLLHIAALRRPESSQRQPLDMMLHRVTPLMMLVVQPTSSHVDRFSCAGLVRLFMASWATRCFTIRVIRAYGIGSSIGNCKFPLGPA